MIENKGLIRRLKNPSEFQTTERFDVYGKKEE